MPLSLSISRHPRLPRRLSAASPPPTASPGPIPLAAPAAPVLKRKDPSLDSADSSPFEFRRIHAYNADNTGAKSSESSSAHDPSLHSISLQSHSEQHLTSLPSRHRTSLLSTASGAFGFRKKIGSVSRKKPNIHPLSPTSNIVPDVIEISARNNTMVAPAVSGTTAHGDYEHEERERLRDAAAQSIGLDPELLHDLSRSDSVSLSDSRQSPFPQPPYIPPFPATLPALSPFTLLSSTLPKYTPPSSLLVYALARQWKPRIIVLTSHSLSQKTHVHLFKGSSKDDKEIERLEVTENSVIFVAEEEVAGRGSVVKLAGRDVSVRRSGTSAEDTLHTMWFLQITDPAESQRWIAAIKDAVLAQRAVRAGLHIPAHTNGGNEPKGDIDVMLSMHLQGLISTSHPTKPSATVSFPSPPVPTSPSPPSSLRSLKTSIPSSPSPATAIKGIFSGTRSRSPSVDGSPASVYPPGHAEDSFGVAGTSLLTMLRTKSSADSSSSPSHSLPLVSLPHVPGQGSPAPSLRSANPPVVITASDLKISKERDAPEMSTVIPEASSSSTSPGPSTPPTPSLSPQGTLTFSLQPPPRKCKRTLATIPAALAPEQQRMYKQASGNRSVAGNFGISSGSTGDVTLKEISPVSPCSSSVNSSKHSFSPNPGLEMWPPCVGHRDGSEQCDEAALALLGSEMPNPLLPWGKTVPSDKLLQSSVITKRWSRAPLPKRLTPPSGPPPSIPSQSESKPCALVEASISVPITCVNTIDRSPARSSQSQSQGRPSPGSDPSPSPTFWKRASGSSMYSTSSTNTSDSRGRSQIPTLFGRVPSASSTVSVVSQDVSSRPMSLSVPASSSARLGAVKRRSMPPPRPAPNFAPPPAPAIKETASENTPSVSDPAHRKSLRSSVAQRALRLSLTSPKPPPSSALPPRPDEVVIAPGHRRSSSTGTSDLFPISAPSSRPSSPLSRNSNPVNLASPSSRSLSIRQRLRILSTPPVSPPTQSSSHLAPSFQVSTLDLGDDDDDIPTPDFQYPHPFGLGEHIMTLPNDPSFLQLSNPATPTTPKPPPRSHLRSMPPSSNTMSGLRTLPLEPDRDFIALSPPPPRRGSKSHVVTVKRPQKPEVGGSGSAHQGGKLVALSQRDSVVSLGFVTTS